MLFYEVAMSYKSDSNLIIPRTVNRKRFSSPAEEGEFDFDKLNRRLANHFDKKKCMVFVFDIKEKLMLAMALRLYSPVEVKRIRKEICEIVTDEFDFSDVKIERIDEITLETFNELYEIADDRFSMDRSYRSFQRENSGLFNTRWFKAEETIVSGRRMSKDQAVKEARSIMGDQSLLDEIDRIYDEKNREEFYGIPVHYCISADGMEAAESIIHIMVKALCHKKRLPGGRICTFTHISEKCFDDDDFSKLCKNASGTTIVIELKGDDTDNGIYASGYNRVIDYLTYLVNKYRTDTQFFFVRNITYEGFSNPLIKRLNEDLELVEVREGIGSREDAEKYLERLIKGSKMSKLYSPDDMRYLPKKKRYYSHDVHEAFEKWEDECLKERAYPAYKSHKSTLTEKKKRKKSNSYNELQDMVGLSDVKNLCDEIICSYKMQKVRGRFGLDEQNLSRHMVFTGNPGSAKTTVARLLCEILADEGVLETGKLVECGRADLVGRYVGWTAKAVKSKFWEAKGGILFIDEAYSLVDDSHSFGDEAINTIVQEMENNMDKVIVIFAGYPDKMEEFIDRNEGLRSRIAFHLNFPDYDQDELLEIMKNMVHKRGLEVEEKAFPVCRDILGRACKQKDYGNGRFVRNYLDQAVMRQSIRLADGKDIRGMKSITKDQAKRLTEEDFMVDPKILFKDQTNNQRRIGFLAG